MLLHELLMAVRYFVEGVRFKVPYPRKISRWLNRVAALERKVIGEIRYVFCSDSYLLDLNRKFRKHTTLTDILTFPGDGPGLSGDVFISVERVRENAPRYKASFEDELHRVIVHGLLHLAGYPDRTAPQKAKMRRKEARSLSLR